MQSFHQVGGQQGFNDRMGHLPTWGLDVVVYAKAGG